MLKVLHPQVFCLCCPQTPRSRSPEAPYLPYVPVFSMPLMRKPQAHFLCVGAPKSLLFSHLPLRILFLPFLKSFFPGVNPSFLDFIIWVSVCSVVSVFSPPSPCLPEELPFLLSPLSGLLLQSSISTRLDSSLVFQCVEILPPPPKYPSSSGTSPLPSFRHALPPVSPRHSCVFDLIY